MTNLKNSLGIRLIIIAALSLLLLIPAILIQNVISERENRRDAVAEEIGQKWGREQSVVGPVLTIPYSHSVKTDDGTYTSKRYAHLLPESLMINGAIQPELRYRGIYEVVVYNSNVTVSGNFSAVTLNSLGVSPDDFLLDDAFVSVGISDMAGIKEAITINWNDDEFVASPGIESADVLSSGISIFPEVEAGRDYTFDISLDLNGSSGLHFSPVGEETSVELQSDWPNPSFAGGFLPATREVNEDGFRSEWKVLHLNRNFPQQWLGANQEIVNTTFGVDLLLPVDEYQKTMRTAKYAIMFIALTFLTFFMIELLSGSIIHPVQYLLIGFALLIFYTLLLSISEYVVFGVAYLVAATAIVLLITTYSYMVLSNRRNTAIVFGVLSLLYGYLYVLLQLQDFALLFGSIGLFCVLACIMYLTRHIDWFEIMGNQSADTLPVKSAG
ncbi:cell envelope integrity protein CreD [Rhodohalobacter sp. 8-1]|uniref:cell envelope integrity protein CreD n=1 Tax=Rhodohalobacter sp. 8-1 TaxID=3131972 RepID=UPI0030ECD44E